MSGKNEKASHILRETLTPFILEYISEKQEIFWVTSVIDVQVSKDYSYADFYVNCQTNANELPKYLAKFAWELKSMIWRDLWARKSPNIRFKISQNKSSTQDIMGLINELTNKYGLDKED